MRKDWDRCGLVFKDSHLSETVTENMYGGRYIDSPFANIAMTEEAIYFSENIEVRSSTLFIDNPNEYIQDGEYQKASSDKEVASIICHQYEREFYDWLERGHRLWSIYPSAKMDSPIVILWHEELKKLRAEFQERKDANIPF